ncbi:hypothetical protein Patl1_04632 [Pistacia atlantica]|uniref:Uncharacterized protein n=1 Tax=Pistacia atlantica TaxID=434234 RepID=A0ACC1BSZ1_9ROSI|nr:hypothetical protein Patl1_04632 [Pistacia atlantica]
MAHSCRLCRTICRLLMWPRVLNFPSFCAAKTLNSSCIKHKPAPEKTQKQTVFRQFQLSANGQLHRQDVTQKRQKIFEQKPILGDGFNFVDFVMGKDHALCTEQIKMPTVAARGRRVVNDVDGDDKDGDDIWDFHPYHKGFKDDYDGDNPFYLEWRKET